MFWTWMLAGNVAVVVGVLVSTLGAGFLFAGDPHKAPFSRVQALFGVIIGTLVATTGGLATTYAWNLSSTAETRAMLAEAEAQRLLSQRNALTDAVLADMEWNNKTLKLPMFTETDPEKLKEHVMLISLAAESTTAIATSGLFLGPNEIEVYRKAAAHREYLRLLQTVVGELNPLLMRARTPEEVAGYRISARDARAVRGVKETGAELARAIEAWQATTDEGAKASKEAAAGATAR